MRRFVITLFGLAIIVTIAPIAFADDSGNDFPGQRQGGGTHVVQENKHTD